MKYWRYPSFMFHENGWQFSVQFPLLLRPSTMIPELFWQFKTNIWFPQIYFSLNIEMIFFFHRFLLPQATLNSSLFPILWNSIEKYSLPLPFQIVSRNTKALLKMGINSNTAQNLNLTKDKQRKVKKENWKRFSLVSLPGTQ